jgi:hypothetical protein
MGFRNAALAFLIALGTLALPAVALFPSSAWAQSKVQQASTQLKSAEDFRVRTQAALALGASGDAAAVRPLCDALTRDKIAAVRTASAAALGKLGKPEGTACLKSAKAAEKDPSVSAQIAQSITKLESGGGDAPPPPGPSAKYYVAIEVANKSSRPAPEVETIVRKTLQYKLLVMSEFAVAPKTETPAQGGQVVRNKKLKGFYLIATVEPAEYAGGNLTQKMKLSIWNYPDKALKGQVSPKLTQTGTPSSDPAAEMELIKLCSENAVGNFIKIVGTLQ